MPFLSAQLCDACEEGNLERVQELLSRGAEIDAPNTSSFFDWTPLHYAAR